MYAFSFARCATVSAFRCALALTLAMQGCAEPKVVEDVDKSPVVPAKPTTAELLEVFYAQNGGRAAFVDPSATALEALLYGEDDVDAGDLTSASARVEAVFAAWPHNSDAWYTAAPAGLNIGDPVAYYGLRMLEHIVAAGPVVVTNTIQMTAIVATCAQVTRPTLPDLEPETVSLQIDPEILADNARVLRQSTNLFRHWVTAITRGLEVELVVVEMSGCATVTYTDNDGTIISYPDADEMIAGIPADVARDTDFFWVVAPSGVPGDGSGYGRHFITGGMGGVGARPLFLSDDAWFLRKPEHLGSSNYDPIERRAYLPQWFQHEFMHHVFRIWPQFELEASDHQWFDLSTWPADFEGRFEPDYYAEAINRRLLDATPSLADGLRAPQYADLAILPLTSIGGSYLRQPVENDWHIVTVTVDGAEATWANQAGVTWPLLVVDGALYSAADSPYGAMILDVELDNTGAVRTLWFGGDGFVRQD